MNNYYCYLIFCFCLFSCNEKTKGQEPLEKKSETSISKATQKGKTPSNDWEKQSLKGSVKSVIDFYESDSSIVMFDASGRIVKEGTYYPVKGFSGHTYEFDSLGNPLKIYDGGRSYSLSDDFSTYSYDNMVNTYNSKGLLIAYETADTSNDSYKCHLKYDNKGRLIEEKNTGLEDTEWYNLTEYAYDKNGFLAKKKVRRVEERLREMWLYENDKFGNIVQETYYSPNFKIAIKKYTYDKAGNPVEIIYTVRRLTYEEEETIYYNRKLSKEDEDLAKLLDEERPKVSRRKTTKTYDERNNCTKKLVYENKALVESTSYVYDEYNNAIRFAEKKVEEDGFVAYDFVFDYQYEYDSEGNWLRKMHKAEDSTLVLEAERIITYHE